MHAAQQGNRRLKIAAKELVAEAYKRQKNCNKKLVDDTSVLVVHFRT